MTARSTDVTTAGEQDKQSRERERQTIITVVGIMKDAGFEAAGTTEVNLCALVLVAYPRREKMDDIVRNMVPH